MKRITVLGTGLVGSLVARDLAADPSLAVTAWDAEPAALDRLRPVPRLDCRRADLSDPRAVATAVDDADAGLL